MFPISEQSKIPEPFLHTIKESKRFIDLNWHTKNGAEASFSLPTLYHKWLNADDTISLLAYGGIIITKPELDGLKISVQRKEALALLSTINLEVNKLADDFLNTSIKIISESTNENFLKTYELLFSKLKSDYEEQLALIPYIKIKNMGNEDITQQVKAAEDMLLAMTNEAHKIEQQLEKNRVVIFHRRGEYYFIAKRR